MRTVKGFYIPGYDGGILSVEAGETRILLPRLTPDDVARAVARLMERGLSVLRTYTTDDLASIFGRVADQWLKPSAEKAAVVGAISDLTGLSPRVVEASINVEQGNSGREAILAALNRDLGDYRALDGFVHDADLGGMTRAVGPDLVAAVLTANVPGLSYLPIVRSLMVKSPLAAKLSTGEPVFGPAWIESLAWLEPPLAECAVLFCWAGGNPDLERQLFAPAQVITLYGGPNAVRELRERIGPHKKILVHGHKIGLVLVGKEALDGKESAVELAGRVALDVAMFDQRACIAPQILYAERGGRVGTEEFASMIAASLERLEHELPPGRMSLDTAATLAQERNLALFEAAQNGSRAVHIQGASTVTHEAGAVFLGVLPTRFLRVCSVDRLEEVFPIIEPHGPALQNAGLAVASGRMLSIAEGLARAGVSHITSPGMMHRPTMRWRHDGMAPFGEMVRWTDIEMPEKEDAGGAAL
jgi:hypothetical protein